MGSRSKAKVAPQKTLQEREMICLQEIETVLEKHRCNLSVEFVKQKAMDQEVLVYKIQITAVK